MRMCKTMFESEGQLRREELPHLISVPMEDDQSLRRTERANIMHTRDSKMIVVKPGAAAARAVLCCSRAPPP